MDTDINDEISKLVDKLSIDLKSKLAKIVEKWEKKIIKETKIIEKKPVEKKTAEKKTAEKKTVEKKPVEKKTNKKPRKHDDTDDSSSESD
jgi:topoisomerase IA-like protein